MRIIAILALCVAFTGCTTVRTIYEVVEVPIPGPCPTVAVPDRPDLPVVTEEMTDSERIRTLVLALAAVMGYSAELETLLTRLSRVVQ